MSHFGAGSTLYKHFASELSKLTPIKLIIYVKGPEIAPRVLFK